MSIEPLQETAFQTSLVLADIQAEVQKILEEVRVKVTEHVSAQVLNDVVETTAKEKELVEEAKQKVAQLATPKKKQA